jgi:hypothetical protein
MTRAEHARLVEQAYREGHNAGGHAGTYDHLLSVDGDWSVSNAKRAIAPAGTCHQCGQYMPLWTLHVCAGHSSVNVPLDSQEARDLTRA